MENPIKMDDLGVPLFLETTQADHTSRVSQLQINGYLSVTVAVLNSDGVTVRRWLLSLPWVVPPPSNSGNEGL